MTKVLVFNGFVEKAFDNFHQSHDQMKDWEGRLHQAVENAGFELQRYVTEKVEYCWLWKDLQEMGTIYSADHPNEPKDRYRTPEDAVKSQVVLHQRFFWLAYSALKNVDVDQFVWLEPTLFKQKGITEEAVANFLMDIEDHPLDKISLPGQWPKTPIQDHINHWRFSGSTFVCPANYAFRVYDAVHDIVPLRTRFSGRLCWDNTTWGYLELLNILPIRWYPGGHDETQLTGYLDGIV